MFELDTLPIALSGDSKKFKPNGSGLLVVVVVVVAGKLFDSAGGAYATVRKLSLNKYSSLYFMLLLLCIFLPVTRNACRKNNCIFSNMFFC